MRVELKKFSNFLKMLSRKKKEEFGNLIGLTLLNFLFYSRRIHNNCFNNKLILFLDPPYLEVSPGNVTVNGESLLSFKIYHNFNLTLL
jgi:hypothetical protein